MFKTTHDFGTFTPKNNSCKFCLLKLPPRSAVKMTGVELNMLTKKMTGVASGTGCFLKEKFIPTELIKKLLAAEKLKAYFLLQIFQF
jgi:hypothetical protein